MKVNIHISNTQDNKFYFDNSIELYFLPTKGENFIYKKTDSINLYCVVDIVFSKNQIEILLTKRDDSFEKVYLEKFSSPLY